MSSNGYGTPFHYIPPKAYRLLNITSDGFLTLLDVDTGNEKADVKVPEGQVGTRVRDMFKGGEGTCSVTILSAVGKEIAVDVTGNSAAME